ncbi:hypothetical protein [Hyphomicrobium zavarzinii]|uniref:hypothetical protein n=1 Tax=Hyphomicrobium zavarzinii TaxID=48292 RepID=UPI00036A026D|nr:hypothetical protein [Hyphomicrobium zavarzinii]
MAWDKTSLETQYTNGTLVAVILDHGVDDEDGAELLQECIDLHNSARGDILNLIDSPSFDDLSGHEFFVAQRFICRLIPSLEGVSAERMMRYVAKLVAKGGNDLLANQPNSAFRAWCEVDSKRAEAVIEAARSDETLAIDHLTFALEATKDLQIARQIALEFDGQRRLSALTALSRIPHQDVHTRADTVLALSSLLDAEPDDALKAHVLAAAVYPFERAGEELTPAALALVSRALSDPGEGTVHVAAQVLFRAKECCSRALTTLLLDALRWVKPDSRGTLEEIDVGLSHVLKVGQGDLVVDYLTHVLTKKTDALTMKPFDSLARELAKAHLTLVSNTIVAWLATGKRELCQGAEELISEGQLDNTPLEPALTSETIADRDVYFTCRKAVGYLFTHPVVAASILISKLRSANATLGRMIKDLLFDPLMVNFGGSVRDYLSKIPETDPAFPHATELLARAEAYLSGLSTIGVVKELHPSEHRRQLERIRQADFNREVMKKAEKLSVFHDLVHRSVLLHGSHSVTYVQDADGARRPVEMKLQHHTMTTEWPRMETIDPARLDLMLLVFRAEQIKP